MSTKLRVNVDGRWYSVEVVDLEARPVQVIVEGETVHVDVDDLLPSPGAAEPEEKPPASRAVQQPGAAASLPRVPTPRKTPPPPATGDRVFNSPMPGIIVSVSVEVGAQVVTGDEICVLEAMKMQQTLRADWTGIVSAVHVQPGQQVSEGDPIVAL